MAAAGAAAAGPGSGGDTVPVGFKFCLASFRRGSGGRSCLHDELAGPKRRNCVPFLIGRLASEASFGGCSRTL
jgi:hypothetical protein